VGADLLAGSTVRACCVTCVLSTATATCNSGNTAVTALRTQVIEKNKDTVKKRATATRSTVHNVAGPKQDERDDCSLVLSTASTRAVHTEANVIKHVDRRNAILHSIQEKADRQAENTI
jgi:hypothetical protein